MTFLDTVASGVWYVLLQVTPDAAAHLALPLLFVVVATGAVLIVRKTVVPGGRLLLVGLKAATIAVAAALLVPDWAVASGYRQVSRRPPTAVYTFGDAVVGGAETLIATFDRVVEPLRRLSRINLLVVLLAVGVWFWLWNEFHCPHDAATCVRPFDAWVWTISR